MKIILVMFVLLVACAMEWPPSNSPPLTGNIAYVTYANGNWSFSVMTANGTHSRHIADCLTIECYPNWSPDGTKFVHQRAQNGGAIYVINVDGTNPHRLSPTPGFDVRPSWSPDGTKIVFNRVVDPSANPPPTDIMLMNADGSNRVTILPANGDFQVEPRFSPDGSKIAFMSNHDRMHLQIWTIKADGSGLKQITTDPANHGDPFWSPDGSKISFGSDREGGGKINIFTMNADGSNIQQITHTGPPYEAGDTSWSPDGKYITFEIDLNGHGQSNPNAPAQVWIVRSNGSAQPWSTGVACAGVGCSPRWHE